MVIVNEINVLDGEYYKVIKTANLQNLAIQYKLTAGGPDTVEIQFWGTVYTDAVENTDDDWVDLTEFLTEYEIRFAQLNTVNDIAFIDSSCTIAKLKIKYIIATAAPNNSIKIGWNTNK